MNPEQTEEPSDTSREIAHPEKEALKPDLFKLSLRLLVKKTTSSYAYKYLINILIQSESLSKPQEYQKYTFYQEILTLAGVNQADDYLTELYQR